MTHPVASKRPSLVNRFATTVTPAGVISGKPAIFKDNKRGAFGYISLSIPRGSDANAIKPPSVTFVQVLKFNSSKEVQLANARIP